ncbi:MAG TPA: lysophospholipid transporter LplT [Alicycliphilus sp.]|jgi:MFS family permease|uniref:Lysophospholipid transporter LplT n=1 Tax=Diaphorobacter limosus TaxID=3036128 RepID=A0ABZ0J060_9BURK|nr:lysophospholipid transporter LplT [Diaphorobacter sp. Y-1]MBP7327095.1 lysophospholipid transporter LplT [Alicycliphilus sp.]MBP7329111.1 lysophospholipid transporter LplT [Alicycliphilus sp.]TXJ08059.1 MAG: lysophospholipid transporter LplT [Alicycliphilus sp.]WOO31089.1 lysophospholipid transporter LplT [Diaphorobacter sp. Y-1]HPU20309.1 lysophospholipid transporter LplT [Alicycliphilus sp.]
MKRGFYTIMSAQFFSSLADNALFVTAVELLRSGGSPEWQRAALVPMFALFYVVLAPFVGAFADSMPKGRVMFISNAIKVVGCLMMLFGSHPLLAYGVVGLGAAAYSPAKYGILTELLPASQLVKANGWIEGLTIGSIILGVVLGGQLVAPHVSGLLLGLDMPGIDLGLDLPAEAAILALVPVYVLAAAINLRIPLTGVAMRPMPRQLLVLLRDFWTCNNRLWRDRLGQISLSTTTLFWGVSGNLRYIVLAWAGVALGYSTTQASALVGVVALGTAAGAVLASSYTQLDKATRVLPLGVAMGLVVILMNAIDNIWLAVPFLILLGGLGGFLVVPMNALLQHRGHNLMGAGRSIAVQNFNEQAAILGMGVLYSLFTKWGLSAFGAIAAFGLLVAAVMVVILRWHVYNVRHYPKEMVQLRKIARLDQH